MSIGIVEASHVNVTVPAALEEAAKQFYEEVLGLRQVEKPDGPRKHVGAWYQLGGFQLHLSLEDDAHNDASDRHVCYWVDDLAAAAAEFRTAGTKIIPEGRASGTTTRFFVRDPGGNLIEIAERL